MLALALDDLLGTPEALATVGQAVLLDLEPTAADPAVGGGVADLLEVGHGGALVAAVHDVVGRGAGGREHVAPDGGDVLAGLDRDDLGGGLGRVRVAVAGHRHAGDVGDGPVVRRHAHALADALVDAADLERREDGVRGRHAGGAEGEDGGLHVGLAEVVVEAR